MAQEVGNSQESRTEQVGVRVTREEKDAIDMVVRVRRPEGGISALVRERSLTEVIEDGRKLLAKLDELAEEVA